ncbi:hypothetical protein ACFLXT_04700 [Chloroflexota bacterium]
MAGRNSGERAADEACSDYYNPDNAANATLQSSFGIPLTSLVCLPKVAFDDKDDDTN